MAPGGLLGIAFEGPAGERGAVGGLSRGVKPRGNEIIRAFVSCIMTLTRTQFLFALTGAAGSAAAAARESSAR